MGQISRIVTENKASGDGRSSQEKKIRKLMCQNIVGRILTEADHTEILHLNTDSFALSPPGRTPV